jgi:hypothetical protein
MPKRPSRDYEQERREQAHEQSVAAFLKKHENGHHRSHSRNRQQPRPASNTHKRIIEPTPSKPGTVFEPMICMDCETVYTTDDTHIRMNSKVLCIKCEGMLTLLHQYDADRDECDLDVRLKETLRTVL